MTKAGHLFMIHAAVLLFGLAGLFGKWIDLPSPVIVLGRVVFATLFLGGLLIYSKQEIRLRNRCDYIIFAGSGIILAVHWASFFQAIRVSSVAVGLVSFSTFPVFAAFLEPFFFHERISRTDIILAFVTLLGVALVVDPLGAGNCVTQGAAWGIFSGFTFAVLSIFNRKYVQMYSSPVIAFYQDLFAAVCLMPALYFYRPVFNAGDLLLLILLGVLFTGIAHSLFIKGLTRIPARTAGIITCLEPVYGIVFAMVLLHEIPGMRVGAGGLVILGAAFYAGFGSEKK